MSLLTQHSPRSTFPAFAHWSTRSHAVTPFSPLAQGHQGKSFRNCKNPTALLAFEACQALSCRTRLSYKLWAQRAFLTPWLRTNVRQSRLMLDRAQCHLHQHVKGQKLLQRRSHVLTHWINQPPRDRLRKQDHGHKFLPREEWSSKEKHIVRHIRRHYKHEGHEALHQQRSPHEEQLVKQRRDAQRKSPCWSITTCSSDPYAVECRVAHDWTKTPLPKMTSSTESRCRNPKIKLWRWLKIKENSTFGNLVKNSARKKMHTVDWSTSMNILSDHLNIDLMKWLKMSDNDWQIMHESFTSQEVLSRLSAWNAAATWQSFQTESRKFFQKNQQCFE